MLCLYTIIKCLAAQTSCIIQHIKQLVFIGWLYSQTVDVDDKTLIRPSFLARLHEVHRAIAVTPVVHIPVPMRVQVRVTLALKFSRSPYLDNHSSESIHTWTIVTL